MDKQRIPRDEQASGKAAPKCCAGCGDTKKARTAPVPNARGYEGPMYCLSCNPRFAGGGDDALRLLVSL